MLLATFNLGLRHDVSLASHLPQKFGQLAKNRLTKFNLLSHGWHIEIPRVTILRNEGLCHSELLEKLMADMRIW